MRSNANTVDKKITGPIYISIFINLQIQFFNDYSGSLVGKASDLVMGLIPSLGTCTLFF